MKTSTIVTLALLSAAGCVHTKTAGETPESQQDEQAAAEKKDPTNAAAPVKPDAEPKKTGGTAAAAAPAGNSKSAANTTGTSAKPGAERAAAAPGRPQLASSPEGMMVPGGPRLIQQALTRLGYLRGHETGELDDETSGALRKFQSDEKLARTGAPDRETIRKLGLKEDQVFRQPGA